MQLTYTFTSPRDTFARWSNLRTVNLANSKIRVFTDTFAHVGLLYLWSHLSALPIFDWSSRIELQKFNNNDRNLVNNHCLQDTLKNNMKTES